MPFTFSKHRFCSKQIAVVLGIVPIKLVRLH